jgi:hypothetical protein
VRPSQEALDLVVLDALAALLPGREPLLWPGNNASEEEKQAWRDRCAEHHRRLREQPRSV